MCPSESSAPPPTPPQPGISILAPETPGSPPLPWRRAKAPSPGEASISRGSQPDPKVLPLISSRPDPLVLVGQPAPCLTDLFSFWPHRAPNPWLSRQSWPPRGAWCSRVSRIPSITLYGVRFKEGRDDPARGMVASWDLRALRALHWGSGLGREWRVGTGQFRNRRWGRHLRGGGAHPCPLSFLSPFAPSVHALRPCPEEKAFPASVPSY